jgi:hypothetical protein
VNVGTCTSAAGDFEYHGNFTKTIPVGAVSTNEGAKNVIADRTSDRVWSRAASRSMNSVPIRSQ